MYIHIRNIINNDRATWRTDRKKGASGEGSSFTLKDSSLIPIWCTHQHGILILKLFNLIFVELFSFIKFGRIAFSLFILSIKDK